MYLFERDRIYDVILNPEIQKSCGLALLRTFIARCRDGCKIVIGAATWCMASIPEISWISVKARAQKEFKGTG